MTEETINVLIVDDEKDICYLLSKLLKAGGEVKTDMVNSLHEAAEIIKNKIPQVVFLDNHLPDGLGVNFISKIKERLPLAKVIMITAHDTEQDREKALAYGADAFVGKPFTRDIIQKTISQVLKD